EERVLCEVFADVLGLPRVGVDDNFFELGGHSLLAVTLVGRVRERGLPVDVRTLFASPTVASLAARAAAQSSTPPARATVEHDAGAAPRSTTLPAVSAADVDRIAGVVPGGAANIADAYPLTALQEGILFHHLLDADRGGDVYLLPTALRLDSRARVDAFLHALGKVVERHDALRTVVVWEGMPEPVQVVLRHVDVPVVEVELDKEEPDPTARLLAESDRPMDLGGAPLLRAHVAAEPGTGRWLLVLQFHQLTQDHTGLAVILEEVAAFLRGEEDGLAEPVSFREFVTQSRQQAGREEHLRFFAKLLGDVTEATTPHGVPNVHGSGASATEAGVPMDRQLALRLREQARCLGVSPAVVFHVVWARVLAAASSRDDVVFGTVLFGRMHAGVGADRIPGMFLNTLPVRLAVQETSTREAVRTMQLHMAELLAHEHAPLALAQQASGVEPTVPLFSSLLNYRYSSDIDQAPQPGLEGVEMLPAGERTSYPLTVSVDDFGTDFRLTVQAVAPLAPEAVCAWLTEAAEHLVTALESTPDLPLRDVDVPCGAEPSTGRHGEAVPAGARRAPDRGPVHTPTSAPARPASRQREQALRGMFADVLGRKRVDSHDSFFALGGHSLLAIRLVARIRAELDAEFSMRAMFERPTVAEIAELLESPRKHTGQQVGDLNGDGRDID
ncbi:condensation domain-containing protein, partial [Streptomyces viridochromogenes]|uniref:condensation domain-containing protein n=1 Tax=Streptomyces viridochromogenes TaxID=1938 RepID=UPI000B246B39